MASVFLIVSAIVVSILILAVVGLAIVNFGHPDDTNEALFPKLVVVYIYNIFIPNNV